ncbi:MAG: HDOD domain-containing protein [Pseudomonadales bacterium]|nr:HDOD domain-containing protein [Pseudomonadales bacterium]
MSSLAEQIQTEIANELSADALELPTLPELALRIRDVADDENVTATRLAAVISTDAGLTTRIIRIANSPLYRGVAPIDTLSFALTRIGLRPAANLALGMAMQQLFQATSDFIDRKLRLTWKQASDIGSMCGLLAKGYTRLRPDLGYLAGLTHSIGVLPVLTWAERHPGILRDGFTLEAVIREIHGPIGSRILRKWSFAEEIAMVPETYLDFQRGEHATDYVDLVQVATLQNYAGTGHPLASIDYGSVRAFTNLGIDPESEALSLELPSEE